MSDYNQENHDVQKLALMMKLAGAASGNALTQNTNAPNFAMAFNLLRPAETSTPYPQSNSHQVNQLMSQGSYGHEQTMVELDSLGSSFGGNFGSPRGSHSSTLSSLNNAHLLSQRPDSSGFSENTLYVRNLPNSVSRDELLFVFQKFGGVRDMRVNFDKKTGAFLGTVFIEFSDKWIAAQAQQEMNGRMFDGFPLDVTFARQRYQGRGSTDFSSRGSVDYSSRSSTDFSSRGSVDFSSRGSADYSDFSPRGSGDFSSRGSADFSSRGSADFSSRGSADFSYQGSADFSSRGSADFSARGSIDFSGGRPNDTFNRYTDAPQQHQSPQSNLLNAQLANQIALASLAGGGLNNPALNQLLVANLASLMGGPPPPDNLPPPRGGFARGPGNLRPDSQRGDTRPPGRSLYVGGLPADSTQASVRALFGRFGLVTEVRVLNNNDGSFKGVAFLDFERQDSATAAIDQLNDTKYQGRILKVNYASNPSSDAKISRARSEIPSDSIDSDRQKRKAQTELPRDNKRPKADEGIRSSGEGDISQTASPPPSRQPTKSIPRASEGIVSPPHSPQEHWPQSQQPVVTTPDTDDESDEQPVSLEFPIVQDLEDDFVDTSGSTSQ